MTLINEPLNVESLSELERGKKGEERRKRSQNPWITNGSGELEIARILIPLVASRKQCSPADSLIFSRVSHMSEFQHKKIVKLWSISHWICDTLL